MYRHYEPLTKAELEKAIKLSEEVKFTEATGSRRRNGLNAPNVLSCYNYSKWFSWNKTQRETFRSFFSESVLEQAVQGWFLEIPKGKGFLDVMDYWVDKPMSGEVVATALKDQNFVLDGKVIMLKAGDQIGFSLRTLHEIRKNNKSGQLWACVMIRGCHTKVEG